MKIFVQSLLILLLVVFWAPVSHANSLIRVQVTGRGFTREAALQDAFNQACQETFGTFVMGLTKTENALLVKNEVLTAGQGFVDGYKVLSEKKAEEMIILDVQVDLSRGRMEQAAAKNHLATWGEYLKGLAGLRQEQWKVRKEARMLKVLFGNPEKFVRHAYRFAVVGIETNDVGPNYVAGNLIIQVRRNQLFFDQYRQLLAAMVVHGWESTTEGLFSSGAETMPYFSTFALNPTPYWDQEKKSGGKGIIWPDLRPKKPFSQLAIVNGFKIHKSLEPFLPNRLLEVQLQIAGDRQPRLWIDRNAVLLNYHQEETFDWSEGRLPHDDRPFYMRPGDLDIHNAIDLTGISMQQALPKLGGSKSTTNRSRPGAESPPKPPEIGGYSPGLNHGGIYVNSAGALASTKPTLRFKTPFRVKSFGQIREILTAPIRFSVKEKGEISVPYLRQVVSGTKLAQSGDYFITEK